MLSSSRFLVGLLLFLCVQCVSSDTILEGTNPTCTFYADSSCTNAITREETLKAREGNCITKEITLADDASVTIISSYDTTYSEEDDDEVEFFTFWDLDPGCERREDGEVYSNIGRCGELMFPSNATYYLICEEEVFSILPALAFAALVALCFCCLPCICLLLLVIIVVAAMISLGSIVLLVCLLACIFAAIYSIFFGGSGKPTFLQYNAEHADVGLGIDVSGGELEDVRSKGVDSESDDSYSSSEFSEL